MSWRSTLKTRVSMLRRHIIYNDEMESPYRMERTRRNLTHALYKSDQRDRSDLTLPWSSIEERDAWRARLICCLYSRKTTKHVTRGSQCYQAAVILHHIGNYTRALPLARQAWKLHHPKGAWITAAIIDRARIVRGRRQLYGTQFRLRPTCRVPEPLPLDANASLEPALLASLEQPVRPPARRYSGPRLHTVPQRRTPKRAFASKA